MTQTTTDFSAVSAFDCNPTSGLNELCMTIAEALVADIAYSPQHDAFVVLTDTDVEAIETYVVSYNTALDELNRAQHNHQQRNNSQSKAQLTQAQNALKDKLNGLATGAGASTSELVWYELHRLGTREHEILYAPGTIINPSDPSENRKFYFITDESEQADNAFKSMRNSDGTIDAKALKENFQSTAANIKAEWDLIDEVSGQVPAKVFADMASPVLAQLLNNELTALDNWVAKVNEALKWQNEQYLAERENAVVLLTDTEPDAATETNQPGVTFEEYGEAQLLCRDIWGDDSPIEFIQYRDFDPSNSANQKNYQAVLSEVREKSLPAAIWHASAEANLMRWKSGARAAAEFDLKKGVLSAEANAELDFALAEGKLSGSLFYPNDEGMRARATVQTSTNKLEWREFVGSMPGRLEFEVESEFLDEHSISRLADAFRYWGLLKTTVNDQYRLAIKGHTSLTGPSEYNAALSLRRAQMVFAFLTRTPGIWATMFKLPLHAGTTQTYWGQREEDYMRQTLLNAEEHRNLWSMFEKADREILIPNYMDYFHYHYMRQGINLPRLTMAEFAEHYMIPLGEAQPLVPDSGEVRANRRVEFILLEPGEVTVEEGPKEVDMGRFRLQFKGHVSAWAGLNVGLSTKVELNMQGGQMAFPERLGGEGKASGFAGAKVEAGLAASLDWQKPEPATANTTVSPSSVTATFNALGTAGYLVQGQAGIGGEAEFRIGYDFEIERFVIKAKAAMCIGFGAGGAFEFSIDAKQVWNFMVLVHQQLRDADFNFVDTFEELAYDRFCLWSYELIKQGQYFQGIAVRAGIESANVAIKTLEAIRELGDDWAAYQDSADHLTNLLDYMREKPEELRYVPPEVKGRILYHLLNKPRRYPDDISLFDVDKDREMAIVHMLTRTVVSKREYLEVLEHTLGQSVTGRTELQRCDHAARVQADLLAYLDDASDRRELRSWWVLLPDPTQCTCSVLDTGPSNPFD